MPKIVQYNLPPGGTVTQIADNVAAPLIIESTDGKEYARVISTDSGERVVLGEGDGSTGIPVVIGPGDGNGKELNINNGTQSLNIDIGSDTYIEAGSSNLYLGCTGTKDIVFYSSPSASPALKISSAGAISTGGETTALVAKGGCHFFLGHSGVETANLGDAARSLLVETDSTTHAGMTFVTGHNNFNCQINFGYQTNATAGGIYYDNGAGFMSLFTSNGERVWIDSGGKLGVGTSSTVGAMIEAKGNLGTNLSDSTSVISDGATGTNRYVESTAHGLAVGSAVKIDSATYTVATVTDADNFILDSDHGSIGDKGQATTDPSLLKVLTGDGGTALELTTGMQLQVPNGSVTRPGLRFAASGDTGFFSPGAGQIAATVDADDAQGGIVMLLEGTEDTPNGKNNTAIGPDALKSLINYATPGSRGSFNVGLGGFAASNITTGTENMAIGRGSLWNAATTSHKNVGIGVNTLSGSGVKTQNTAVGHKAGDGVTTGTTNVMIGFEAGDSVTTTGTGTYVGASTAASAATGVSNETCLGYAAVGQGSNTVMLGDSNVTGLHCYDTSISSPSDSRIKNNVEDSTLGLDFISALRPVKYQKKHPSEFPEEIREARWSDQIKTETADNGTVSDVIRPADTKPDDWQPRTQYGLIAQEVRAVMEAQNATDWQGHTVLPSGMESLAYGNLVTVLVGAVQELKKRIEELENGD